GGSMRAEGIRDEGLSGGSMRAEGIRDEHLSGGSMRVERIRGERLSGGSVRAQGIRVERLSGGSMRAEGIRGERLSGGAVRAGGVRDKRLSGARLARVVAISLLALGLAVTRRAEAHPLDLGYLRITTTGDRTAIQLDLDIDAAAKLIGVDARTLDTRTVQALAEELARKSFERQPIMTATGECSFTRAAAALSGRTVSAWATAECPAAGEGAQASGGPRRWELPMVADGVISSRFPLMVKRVVGGSERLAIVDKHSSSLVLAPADETTSGGGGASGGVGFFAFVRDGIEHIGAAPNQWRDDSGGWKLPDGIDHILFLLALLLAGGRLSRLVGIASGFTLGHSITLALAALDIVRLPASIIEPLIALSIAFAAAEAFTSKLERHRWKIATGFGFIHGFGFASALSHLALSTRGKVTALFGFNLGVELGQLVIVLLAAPLILALHRHKRIGTPVLRVAAGVIFVCGLYWFVVRAFG
ncbi:MAG TPA: HupE/UreJ family protein, partial [Kofleriaceae bacterium]|nr:HupE/UreJ family protein [Kofleriaceae bacterium]